MNKIYITMIIVAIIGVFLFWQIPNFNTELLDSYLFTILIFVEVALFFTNFIIQTKNRDQDERKKHSKDLIPAYESLSRLVMRRKEKKLIKMLLPEQKFDENDDNALLESIWEDTRHLEIKLKYVNTNSIPYLDWALKHLDDKEYKEIKEFWTNVNQLESTFEKQLTTLEDTIKNFLTEKMKEIFPNFKEFEGDDKPSYFIDGIAKCILDELEYKDHNKEPNFGLSLIPDSHGFKIIMGFTLMQSPNKNDLRKKDLENIMSLVFYNEKVMEQSNNIAESINKSIETLSKFTDKMKHLTMKINGGYVMKGKCELGY